MSEAQKTRTIPLAQDGRLLSNCSSLLFSHMCYPEDPQSLASLLKTVEHEEKESPGLEKPWSEYAVNAIKPIKIDRLLLLGEMGVYMAGSIHETGEPAISKAAFLTSENHSLDELTNGKKVASSPGPIRRMLGSHGSVLHFWSAYLIHRLPDRPPDPLAFLNDSLLFLSKFQKSELNQKHNFWVLPRINGVGSSKWPEEGLVVNRERVDEILKSYKSRSGI